MFKELKSIFKNKDKQTNKKNSTSGNTSTHHTSTSKSKSPEPINLSNEKSNSLFDQQSHKRDDIKDISVSPKSVSNSQLLKNSTPFDSSNEQKTYKDIKFKEEFLNNPTSNENVAQQQTGGKGRLHSIASRNTQSTHVSSIVSLDSSWVDDDYGDGDDDEGERSINIEEEEDEDELQEQQTEEVSKNNKSAKKEHRHRHKNGVLNNQPQTLNAHRTLFPEQSELKDYLLLEKIGEGAFSQVYKCVKYDMQLIYRNLQDYEENDEDKATTDYVAIKVINKKMLDSTSSKKETSKMSSREQVLKEIMIHKLVSQRPSFSNDNLEREDELKRDIDSDSNDGYTHIVRFIDFYETDSYYYIIQELLSGGEIFGEVVKYTYFSEDLSRFVVKQLAFAIKHLHSLGVVHRDIKLENLLFETVPIFERNPYKNDPALVLRKSDDPKNKLDEGIFIPGVGAGTIGLVKLADFGLSKKVVNINNADLSTPCGTVGYTAPEVVKDERYSFQVDLWGIGCVLYTVLCGFPPFYDEKIDVLTEKISKGEYTYLRPWWDEISEGAKNCVSRLLEIDPLKRYTIDDLLADPWFSTYDCQTYYSSETQERLAYLQDKVFERRKRRIIKKQKIKEAVNASSNIVEPIDDDFVCKIPIKASIDTSNTMLYSPAAVAMRDAFDITNAVQRIKEEHRNSPDINSNNKTINFAKQAHKNNLGNNNLTNISEETEDYSNYASAVESNPLDTKFFQLKLNSSTIVKRRHNGLDKKNKKQSPLSISTSINDNNTNDEKQGSKDTANSPLRQSIF
ncbi:Pkinase-domain-containing protein [Hanseniaspora valbyensis NRRL Y-1626]|uniref:Pkinase-domain-containing protein n=1 Tax=Hanseniaspora valbyensis NRRL Y-1626 TaxID=766949 RepID=A0A1B7TK57_9ASCO|nr:Pkinase-domain-containing protein [Hanseniaspora valbyensis NRRL Y-1626]